jgi:hypothetical protein
MCINSWLSFHSLSRSSTSSNTYRSPDSRFNVSLLLFSIRGEMLWFLPTTFIHTQHLSTTFIHIVNFLWSSRFESHPVIACTVTVSCLVHSVFSIFCDCLSVWCWRHHSYVCTHPSYLVCLLSRLCLVHLLFSCSFLFFLRYTSSFFLFAKM